VTAGSETSTEKEKLLSGTTTNVYRSTQSTLEKKFSNNHVWSRASERQRHAAHRDGVITVIARRRTQVPAG